jgi:primase-polymerase (primpol)-like protein
MDRACSHCGSPLAWDARSDARFCSVRCRVAHHRAASDPIPAELRTHARWLRHDRKRPITTTGTPATSTDPRTWTDYAAAKTATVGDGLGFALNGDGIVCIDLDHCLEDGCLTPSAVIIIGLLPATYVELSPSGSGLHIWGYAQMDRARVRPGVEVYADKRYMTVTGKRYAHTPSVLGDLAATIERF